jgi:ribosomal protein L34
MAGSVNVRYRTKRTQRKSGPKVDAKQTQNGREVIAKRQRRERDTNAKHMQDQTHTYTDWNSRDSKADAKQNKWEQK